MAPCFMKMASSSGGRACAVPRLVSSPPGAGYVTPTSHVYGHLRLMTNLSGLCCSISPPLDHVWRIYGRIDGRRWVAPSSAFYLMTIACYSQLTCEC